MIVKSGIPYEDPKEYARLNLRYSLQLLACDAESQIAHFLPPDFWNKAYDMAEDYDYFVSQVRMLFSLTPDQNKYLNELDEQFNTMWDIPYDELWTDDALRSDPRWQSVREIAKHALQAWSWAYEVPPPQQYSTSQNTPCRIAVQKLKKGDHYRLPSRVYYSPKS
jgi:hypothetical protein